VAAHIYGKQHSIQAAKQGCGIGLANCCCTLQHGMLFGMKPLPVLM